MSRVPPKNYKVKKVLLANSWIELDGNTVDDANRIIAESAKGLLDPRISCHMDGKIYIEGFVPKTK